MRMSLEKSNIRRGYVSDLGGKQRRGELEEIKC